ncbi:MAG: hypothetical protein SGI88_03445 [Candidatus Hydrogenedentes bacterium]|nr:hypothetical protein [Candidatus Hydrogenedentota bacterium]
MNTNAIIEWLHRDELEFWLSEALCRCSQLTRDRITYEIRNHYEACMTSSVEQGLSASAAHRAALQALGSPKAFSKQCLTLREEAFLRWMKNPFKGMTRALMSFLILPIVFLIPFGLIDIPTGSEPNYKVFLEAHLSESLLLAAAVLALAATHLVAAFGARRFGALGFSCAFFAGLTIHQLCLSALMVHTDTIGGSAGIAWTTGTAVLAAIANIPFFRLDAKLRRLKSAD